MEYYKMDKEGVLHSLDTDENIGLSNEEANKRKSIYGKNAIIINSKDGIFSRLIDKLKEPLISILLITSVISLCLGEIIQGICVIFLVSIIAGIFIFIEITAEKKLEELNSMSKENTLQILRNGETTDIFPMDITVGDIVYIAQGDKIPADGRIISSSHLTINEFLVTGNSQEVLKKIDPIKEAEIIPLSGIDNMAYSGSYVVRGSGSFVVTSIGNNTVIGAIQHKIRTEQQRDVPFQKKIQNITNKSFLLVIFAVIIIFLLETIKIFSGSGYVSSRELFLHINNILITSVSIALAATHATFYLILFLSLSINMKKMANSNFIVRKLESFEKLAYVDTICSNNLDMLSITSSQVADVWHNGSFVSPNEITSMDLLENFCINLNSGNKQGCIPIPFSDKLLDNALLSLAKLNNIDFEHLQKIHPEPIAQFPYSSARRIMTTVIEYHNGFRVYSKGSPDDILPVCNRINYKNRIIPFTDEHKLEIQLLVKEFQAHAKKVVAFAYSDSIRTPNCDRIDILERNLIFSGFVSIEQLLYPESNEAILNLKNAGIEFKILSDESLDTVKTQAKRLGMIRPESILKKADELLEINNEELSKSLDPLVVVCESDNEMKKKAIKIFQDNKSVVALAGDDINDYSPIKVEDFSFSMDISGTSFSKETSDVVVLNDSFSVIPAAIKWCRGLLENTKRIAQYFLTLSGVLVLFVVLSEVLGLGMLFTSIHFLILFIFVCFLPPILLGTEFPADSLLVKKPISKASSLITHDMTLNIILKSLFILFILFIVMIVNPWNSSPPLLSIDPSWATYFPIGSTSAQSSAITFSFLVLFLLWNTISSRGIGNRSILINFRSNFKYLLYIATIILIFIFTIELFGRFMGMEHLEFSLWLKIIAYTFGLIVIGEIIKLPLTLISFVLKLARKAK